MASAIFTPKFWADAFERVVKTAAQSAIAAVATTGLIQDVQWDIVGGTVAIASALSLLTSIASAGVADRDSASLVKGA